jgi:tetratricopeptide (TPR) repeat protein
MPFILQPDMFFERLNNFYTQEFLDDLLARCNDDFSDQIYENTHYDGNSRFRHALSGVFAGISGSPGRPYASNEIENLKLKMVQFEWGLNFITRLPNNKTCEGMRKQLFFQLFRYIPIDMTTALVDALSDAEIKKELFTYLAEVEDIQRLEDISSDLTGQGHLKYGESPSREELQTLQDATENIFERCKIKLALVMFDLEHGNIEQAVKQARELEEIYAGVKERHWGLGGTEKFFSKLAKKLLQEEKYDEGIDYLIEGAGNFVVGQNINWSVDSPWLHEPFIVPPLRELYTAVQTEPARTAIRKKLQSLLEKVKDFKTVSQSQQFRAVVETQIALGFEEDAIPVLKTTKFIQKSGDSYIEPLWNGMTAMQFQLRCRLFDEALETYPKITFTDRPGLSGRSGSDDRTQFLQGLVEMLLAREKFDQAEKIIELVRSTETKPFMLMALARAYQQSGDLEKALEIIDALGPPPAVRLVLVSGWSPPPPPPETHRALGYLMLLEDLLKEKASQEQHTEKIETLLDRYCTEINKTEEPQSRHKQYSDVITLLYQNDQRESAMKIVDEVDSPYYAAWILLNIAVPLEKPPYGSLGIVQSRGFGSQRYYSDYHSEEQFFAMEYNSPDHFLDIASAMQSAEEIMKPIAARNKVWAEQREMAERGETPPTPKPFQPDTAAMKVLLDKAAVLIGKENDPANKANVLGAMGKMEYVYFAEEDAQKHFNEALELLKTANIAPNSNAAAQELPKFFLELGDKKRAVESINITLFGNDPNGNDDAKPFSGHTSLLILLAQCGEGERAYELFLKTYELANSGMKPVILSTLPIIALYHDAQNPEKPMLPKAKEQYQQFYCTLVKEVNNEKEGYLRESALSNILYCWVSCEKGIQLVQEKINKQVETRGNAEEHRLRRQLGSPNSLNEYGNPLVRGGMGGMM